MITNCKTQERVFGLRYIFFPSLFAFVTTLMQIIKLSLTEPLLLTLTTISCNNSWNGCAVCQTDGYQWEDKISLGANRSNCFELTHQYDISFSVLLLLFIFNWRLIALQYCVGFCHTTTWVSHRHIHDPSLSNLSNTLTVSHLSKLSRSTRLRPLCYPATCC